MVKLNDQELLDINGGAISFGAILLIGGIVTFVIGLIDGYIRPLRCR